MLVQTTKVQCPGIVITAARCLPCTQARSKACMTWPDIKILPLHSVLYLSKQKTKPTLPENVAAYSFHLDCHSLWCFFYNTFITEPVLKIKVNT